LNDNPPKTARKIEPPFTDPLISSFKAGDRVELYGEIYTARDAAHAKIVEMLKNGEKPPFDFAGQAVFYAGPCPAPPGKVIGSIGPTTSERMDAYSPFLIENGLKVMIGKGARNAEVKEAIVRRRGVYLISIGGAAALTAKCVKSAEPVAFPELGTEAVRRLTVEGLPLIVAVDCEGRDIYDGH